MASKTPGVGQAYPWVAKDADGDIFDGGKKYKMHLPPNIPAKLYWSVTAYDRQTHALIVGMSRPSLASNANGVQKNADGSTDVYFGPKAPAGKTSNWVPTDPKRQFELLFRLYGPKKPLFEKTWKLPDVVEVPN